MCCFDTVFKTPLARAANALRLLWDKSLAKQGTWLEQYLPRWITMLLQWYILYIMFWQAMMSDDGLWVCVWFILHYVLSQAVMGDMICLQVCIWCIVCFVRLWRMTAMVCASTCMCMCLYVDELTFTRAAASECLVWPEHPEVLFGGWWIKPSQREGGTGSVRALLASLSSGRHWEWLADPLLTLVRQRNPSSWLKCHLTADNWLITVRHIALFSLN